MELKCHHNLLTKSEAVIDGLAILMKDNPFIFNGEVYYQLTGTTMGMVAAPAYETLLFWIHENLILTQFPQSQLSFHG